MPATISSTTAGTRMRGNIPTSRGAPTAMAATTTRLAKDTSGMAGLPSYRPYFRGRYTFFGTNWCRPSVERGGRPKRGGTMAPEVERTEEEWRERLTPAQYRVLRRAGTERAFTGEYYDTHDDGMYHCAACGAE